ncbi:hypothetical protein Tco_0866593 [Tanacetum coccineum]
MKSFNPNSYSKPEMHDGCRDRDSTRINRRRRVTSLSGKSKIPNWSGGVECGGGAVECRWWWYDGGGGSLIFVRKCALNPANNRLAKDITDGTAHRKKKYAELTEQEKLQDDCDVQATNIILQGLPPDVYSVVNHHQAAKDI